MIVSRSLLVGDVFLFSLVEIIFYSGYQWRFIGGGGFLVCVIGSRGCLLLLVEVEDFLCIYDGC